MIVTRMRQCMSGGLVWTRPIQMMHSPLWYVSNISSLQLPANLVLYSILESQFSRLFQIQWLMSKLVQHLPGFSVVTDLSGQSNQFWKIPGVQ